MAEDDARRLTLLRAVESAPEGPLWTDADRRWASRAAQQALGDDAARDDLLVERARLAMQRLAPRDAGLQRAVEQPLWRRGWVWAAALAGLVAGVASDALLAGPYFNLLSAPFFVLLVWNVVIYLVLAVQAVRAPAQPGPVRQWLARAMTRSIRRLGRSGPLADFAARWATLSTPLTAARGALLMHVASAALALGLVGGMYARALVLDYRAGWATTLLQPAHVRAVLDTVHAPAQVLSGIRVPDEAGIEALRVTPERPASASAAPWIHLMALTLGLLVLVPRVALAAAAAWRAQGLARRFPLSLEGDYFDRLLPPPGSRRGAWWVQPHGQAPSAQTATGLRDLLGSVFGEGVRLTFAEPIRYGDEDEVRAAHAEGRALALFDLAATPEDEVHGRLVRGLPGQPLIVVDSAAFVQRFGDGDRLTQRRAAWQALADSLAAPLVIARLDAPPVAQAEDALRAAIAG